MLKGELFTLSMFSLLGILVMVAANNFLVVYLGLELMSLSLYALVAMRRDDTGATEAAMKYFVLGALASGFLLYGLSMMYGATGSLEMNEVFKAIGTGRINRAVLVLGTVFVVAGLAFKLGAVPFHMWVPDVYQGAPTSMTLLVGGAPKLAAFAITIRLLVEGMIGVALDWQQMLVLLSLASMLLGNLAAIAQTQPQADARLLDDRPDRLHAARPVPGRRQRQHGLGRQRLQLGDVLRDHRRADDARHLRHDHAALARRPRGRADRRFPRPGAAQPVVRRRDGGVHVLARRHPADGRLLRQARGAAGAGLDQRAGLIWLAVAAVVLSLLGAYYYLRVVKVMYFDEPVDTHPIEGTRDVRILLSFNGAAVLLLGILPGGLMQLCAQAIVQMFADLRRAAAPARDALMASARLSTTTRRTCARRCIEARQVAWRGCLPRRPPRPRRLARRQRDAEREYIVHPGAVMVVAAARRRPRRRRAPVALSDGAGDARVSGRQARAGRAGARLRGARADRGNRLPRRRMGARRRPPQRDRLLQRRHRDLVRARPRRRRAQLDAGEFLDVFEASVDELETRARRGEITDAKTLIGLLWLRQLARRPVAACSGARAVAPS